MNQELYDSIRIASESYLYGNPDSEELDLLNNNLHLFLEALKAKKKDVEYQFAAHKVTTQSYAQEYLLGTLEKIDYYDLILDERKWRAKAVSFLCRIETTIIETKVKLHTCQQN